MVTSKKVSRGFVLETDVRGIENGVFCSVNLTDADAIVFLRDAFLSSVVSDKPPAIINLGGGKFRFDGFRPEHLGLHRIRRSATLFANGYKMEKIASPQA